MAVDFDIFLSWAEDRFDGDVIVSGEEIRLNSIFTEDHKHKMWCNPYGGIHEREDGCYRCFYTDNIGTLVGLVMLVDGCDYWDAKQTLNGNTGQNLADLEEKVHEFFAQKEKNYNNDNIALDLPPNTYVINEMSKRSFARMEGETYLEKRLLPIHNLMYCTEGKYKNRIVIPYYDKENNLIYWNTRHVGQHKLRYWGPHKSCGIGKGDVLYLPEWPEKDSLIYLTEGEFDALTLYVCGLSAAACGGKYLSDKQILMLQGYKVCLALDQDSSGFEALVTMGRRLVAKGIPTFYVRPPIGFKDWNKLLISLKNKDIMLEYIKKHIKPYDVWTSDNLLLNKF